jgi:hypothetical protein
MKAERCRKHRLPKLYDWRICSHGPWEPVCEKCDLELNKIALKWRFPKSWKRRYEAYKRKQQSTE